MLLTGADINMLMERERPRPQSQVLTEAMLVFEIVLYPRDLKKQNKYKALASPPGLPRNRSQSDLYFSYQESWGLWVVAPCL